MIKLSTIIDREYKKCLYVIICCEICDKPIFKLSNEEDILVKSANDYKVFCAECSERRYL